MGTQLREKPAERIIGRYAIYDEIASGGMAVVHIGRLLGQAGFSRTVAIKRLHPQFAKDPTFVSMFLDEARLAVRVQHPNVVAPLDVLVVQGEVLVVMEYVSGDTLARLQRSPANAEQPPSPGVVTGILCDALYGLHAAHEALGENGQPLHIVHRDVTPQNIMVGLDGIARVLDFGVAKAAMRSQCTTDGMVKGKIAYMAPEQIEAKELDCRTDIFAAGIVAWEALSGQRLFNADQATESIAKILKTKVDPPSKYRHEVTPELDSVILKALKHSRRERFASAREFAMALEHACPPATRSAVGDWVRSVAGNALASLAERVAAIEAKSSSTMIRAVVPPPAPSGSIPLRVPPPPTQSASRIMLDSHPRITMPLINAPNLDFVDQLPTIRPPDKAARAQSSIERRARIPRKSLVIAGCACLGIGLVAVVMLLLTARHDRAKTGNPSHDKTPALAVSAAPARTSSTAPVAQPFIPAPVAQTEVQNPGIRTDSAQPMPLGARSGSPKTASRSRSQVDATSSAKSVTRSPSVDAAKTSGKAKAKVDCTLPYYLDSKGIRRLKPECM